MDQAIQVIQPFVRSVLSSILCFLDHQLPTYLVNLVCSCSRSSESSRNVWLQFDSKLPTTLFTGNKIVSESRSGVKIRLYDPHTQQTVTWGPLSSMKVAVVVVEGDFAAEEWSEREFESKVVQSREGKRPLICGDVSVSLKNGEGYINHLFFTDNSSWIRSGSFRLGLTACDETAVREGVSNAFKVKDQRGERKCSLFYLNWFCPVRFGFS